MFLGIKGAMSEAELGWMRQRMRGALISKVRRGECRIPVAAGYKWEEESAHLILDPDEQVQRALRLVFERFRIERNACRVARYLEHHQVRLPAHQSGGDMTVHWSIPSQARIFAILHNPIYAGAYVYGRSARRLELVDGQVVRRIRTVPMEEWLVVLQNHHPGYISWEEFVENRRILLGNTNANQATDRHGAAHRGEALLQGLVLCGRCGCRMNVHYNQSWRTTPRRTRYLCKAAKCKWSVSASLIDKAVEALFLEALHPDAIALGLAVTEDIDHQQAELDRQWTLRLERARYEAKLAERRYKAVDPDHRTVARNLEREWDVKLSELDRVENEYREVQTREKLDLTPADRASIAKLSGDVPQIWHSPTTTMAQRKAMLRTLVSEVGLKPLTDSDHTTQVQVLWKTEAVSELIVPRRHGKGWQVGPAELERIRTLAATGKSTAQIAEALNEEQLRTAKGLSWSAQGVWAVCHRHGVLLTRQSHPLVERRSDGAYSIRGVARRLRVTTARVRYWVEHSWLFSMEGGGRGNPRWFLLDQATLAHLKRTRTTHSHAQRRPTATARKRVSEHRPRRQPSSNPIR